MRAVRRLDPKETAVVMSLRLPPSLVRALEKRAARSGRGLSETARELIAAGLSEWSSTESETRALREEVRALREEVRAALGRRKSR